MNAKSPELIPVLMILDSAKHRLKMMDFYRNLSVQTQDLALAAYYLGRAASNHSTARALLQAARNAAPATLPLAAVPARPVPPYVAPNFGICTTKQAAAVLTNMGRAFSHGMYEIMKSRRANDPDSN